MAFSVFITVIFFLITYFGEKVGFYKKISFLKSILISAFLGLVVFSFISTLSNFNCYNLGRVHETGYKHDVLTNTCVLKDEKSNKWVSPINYGK